jgi:U3 small nucleolar RNA-associated protein 19
MKNLAQVLESDFTASKDESEREEYELLVVANALRMVRMVQMPEVPEDIETFLVEPVDGEAADSDIEGDDGSEEEEEVEKEPAVGAGAKRKADDEKKKKKTTGVRSIKYHQHAFSMAWIALLRHRLPQDAYRRVLVQLPDDIMPHLANPLLLADFLTDSYNIGGVTSLLSLNSLFILIQDYNFDYPDFYNKLYELLNDPVLLTAKQRARFFGLLDLFLSSTHLPAYMVAAFAKRLSRSALTAEPGAILFIIPMVYNLILRHKECVQLIHRTGAGTVAEKAALRREELASANAVDAASKMLKKQKTEIALEHGQDPFQADEKDPIQCRALQSSLWELYSMRQHYNAEVAVRAKLFEDKLRQQFLDLDDCMDISYKSVFDAQLKRKEKGKVPLAFRPCTALFETATAETEAEDAREPDAFARVFAL